MVGNQEITLYPGQFVFGLHKASIELDMSIKTIRTMMVNLEKSKNLARKTATKYSIVTVCNWDIYQSDEIGKGNQSGTERASKGQSKGNKQEHKEQKEERNIYSRLLDFWNAQNVIVHRILTDKAKRTIKTTAEKYTEEEIMAAIENYATVLKSNDHYWTHKWTLEEFLKRGIGKFLNEADPLNNFRNRIDTTTKPSKYHERPKSERAKPHDESAF